MNIYLDMVGCRLNQSEIESMANMIRSQGHEIISESQQADVIIINTCCVTAKAAADSRKMIRHVARRSNGQVIVTGCWSTLFSNEAFTLPNVAKVVPNQEKSNLVVELLGVPAEVIAESPLIRLPLPGERRRTRAFIKIQDGCNDHCTFCITRLARGRSSSMPISLIERDIQAAIVGGAKEIVITGVQLGSWGRDLNPELSLKDLISGLLKDERIKRLRLSSIEPWDLYASFFELWQDPRLCRHLHIPLQSGCVSTLRRMARRITPPEYNALVDQARDMVPGIAITTDVIAGFPGETDADFEESLVFIEAMGFAGGHVFSYSAMQGTPAASYSDQVPHAIRKDRNCRLRLSLNVSSTRFKERCIGHVYQVLWEKVEQQGAGVWLRGLTDTYLPVVCEGTLEDWNTISNVEVMEIDKENNLLGRSLEN